MAILPEDFVKETTATTGTGTITLVEATGRTRFSEAYAVGEVVPYVIKNGDNLESGEGTVGAGETLARTTIKSTLIAGVYLSVANGDSPVAITLSGTSEVISGVTNATLDSFSPKLEPIIALAALDIDLSLGSVHTKTIAVSSTITVSGLTSGKASGTLFKLTTAGTETITWNYGAAIDVVWDGGAAPTNTTAGTMKVIIYTDDGTVVSGAIVKEL